MKRILVAGLVLLAAEHAEAKCGLPPLELVWSYPAAGEQDVPINAELWAQVPSPWLANVVVRLDGQPLAFTPPALSRGLIHLTPAALQPDHDYVLQLDFAGSYYDAGAGSVLEVRFRTGARAAVAPAAPKLGPDRLLETDSLAGSCPEVLRAQACLDTGPNTLHTFEDSGPKPVAWQVGDDVLPARCELPQLLRHRGVSTGECVPVRAIGAGGLRSEPTQACLPDDRVVPTAAKDGGASQGEDAARVPTPTNNDGCNLAHGSGSLGWLLLLLARRRKRG